MFAGWYPRLERVFPVVDDDLEHDFPREVQVIRYVVRITVDRCSPPKPGSYGEPSKSDPRLEERFCFVDNDLEYNFPREIQAIH